MKKFFVLGIIFILSLGLFGCSDGSDSGGIDFSKLVGNWEIDSEDSYIIIEDSNLGALAFQIYWGSTNIKVDMNAAGVYLEGDAIKVGDSTLFKVNFEGTTLIVSEPIHYGPLSGQYTKL